MAGSMDGISREVALKLAKLLDKFIDKKVDEAIKDIVKGEHKFDELLVVSEEQSNTPINKLGLTEAEKGFLILSLLAPDRARGIITLGKALKERV
jgi:hypothetical protein